MWEEKKRVRVNCNRFTVVDAFSILPSDKKIWKSIHSKDLPKPFKVFLWKIWHNMHRVGNYWENIPDWEHWSISKSCGLGATDDLEHIMLECKTTGQDLIWRLARELWELRNLNTAMKNIGSITRCTFTNFKTWREKPRISNNWLYKILIAESAMLIWTIRNWRVCKNITENNWLTREEIRVRWATRINKRLTLDHTSTHQKYGSYTTKKDVVLKTLSGTFKNENSLPDNWINMPGVLVGIGCHEHGGRGRGSNRLMQEQCSP